jgi:hypothetical protein
MFTWTVANPILTRLKLLVADTVCMVTNRCKDREVGTNPVLLFDAIAGSLYEVMAIRGYSPCAE